MQLEDRALDRIALRLALLLESGRNCGRAAEDDTDRLCTVLLLELLMVVWYSVKQRDRLMPRVSATLSQRATQPERLLSDFRYAPDPALPLSLSLSSLSLSLFLSLL